MDEVDYIYDFLHDPRKTRWPQPIVDYLLGRASEDIKSNVEAFLKSRDIKRELAQAKQLGTEDKTATIQVIEGQDIYALPEDFLRISSVIYDGCFIPHKIPSCDIEIEPGSTDLVREYNSSGMPKGKFKIAPMPRKYSSEEVIEHTKTCSVVNKESLYGWGLANIPSSMEIIEETTYETVVTELEFSTLEVTYEVAKTLEFEDDGDEALAEALSDKQLLKHYVCGHLLRDDRDSNSRSLGSEELQLYTNRIKTLMSKYTDLYDVDNTLEIASADEGYVDTKVNSDVVNKDAVDIKMDKLEKDKAKAAQRNRKSRFDTLGVR